MTAITSKPSYYVELKMWETIGSSVSALTFDPFKNSFYYLFPWFKLVQSSYNPVFPTDTLEGLEQIDKMPKDQVDRLFHEIDCFKVAIEINRKINPYISSGFHFLSIGGTLSFLPPAIIIPDEKAFPRNNQTVSEETQFLIAREIGHIKENDALVRLVVKIIIFAALFAAFHVATGGFGAVAYGAFFAIAIPAHIIIERMYQTKIDRIGTKILSKRLQIVEIGQAALFEKEANRKAHKIALDALKKIREENQRMRKKGCFYITEKGNNWLDVSKPFITDRIAALEALSPTTLKPA
jgi:hypothetical protein